MDGEQRVNLNDIGMSPGVFIYRKCEDKIM